MIKMDCEEKYGKLNEYELGKKIEEFIKNFYPINPNKYTISSKGEMDKAECLLKIAIPFFNSDITPLCLVGADELRRIILISYKDKNEIPNWIIEWEPPRVLKPL